MKSAKLCVAMTLAAALLAGPAVAVQQQPVEQPVTIEDTAKPEQPSELETPKAKTEEELICRRVKLTMDSRRATKVCKTAEEWRAFNEER